GMQGMQAGSSKAPQASVRSRSIPEITFFFYYLSNAFPQGVDPDKWCKSQFFLAKAVWTSKDTALQKYIVNFVWDGKLTAIHDPSNQYKLIEFHRQTGSPRALQLVKEHWSNLHRDPKIPIFVCNAAWDEVNEPGPPRAGVLRGYTLTHRGNPWFIGER